MKFTHDGVPRLVRIMCIRRKSDGMVVGELWDCRGRWCAGSGDTAKDAYENWAKQRTLLIQELDANAW